MCATHHTSFGAFSSDQGNMDAADGRVADTGGTGFEAASVTAVESIAA
jgi:hypothetical protein